MPDSVSWNENVLSQEYKKALLSADFKLKPYNNMKNTSASNRGNFAMVNARHHSEDEWAHYSA